MIQDLRQQLLGAISRLSDRERQLALVAGGILILLISLITWLQISSSIADRESRIELKSQGLMQVEALSGGFRERAEAKRRLEAQLKGAAAVSLFSYVEEAAQGLEITISNMTPRSPKTKGKIVEEGVVVRMDAVSPVKLAALVNRIQGSPQMVKIQQARVRRKASSEDTVEATLTLSSFKMK